MPGALALTVIVGHGSRGLSLQNAPREGFQVTAVHGAVMASRAGLLL